MKDWAPVICQALGWVLTCDGDMTDSHCSPSAGSWLSQGPSFQIAAFSHPQALDGLLIPVVIPVEFPQDDFEVCCLDHGDLPQVRYTVGSHHHSTLIHQGAAAHQEPFLLEQVATMHPAGPPVDGRLPWPAQPLGLWSSDVFSFPTDYGESTSSVRSTQTFPTKGEGVIQPREHKSGKGGPMRVMTTKQLTCASFPFKYSSTTLTWLDIKSMVKIEDFQSQALTGQVA